jgi:excisionase family DNA binding protein
LLQIGVSFGPSEGDFMATAIPTKPKVLRRAEAAERLGVHPNTLANWVQRGWLKGVKMPGGETRFREEDIEELRERIYAE